MTKSILVTGASGFIGSRLLEMLLEKKYNAISVVRDIKKSNPNSKTIVGDITDSNLKINLNELDCVFHLASHTPFEKNKKILKKVNLEGTKNLFFQIQDKIKAFIYISGLGVYGDSKGTIVDESFPYNAQTEFVKIRLETQKFLENSCKKSGINFSVVHLGDVYGPGGWFYEFLIKRMLKNTFRLPGGGDYYKGFVHRDDAVGSMISVMEQNPTNGLFIVADSTPVTFREFANFTAEQIGTKLPGSVPILLAKAVLGTDLIKLLTTSMKVSNKKISQIYEFKYPSYREGIFQVLTELREKKLLS